MASDEVPSVKPWEWPEVPLFWSERALLWGPAKRRAQAHLEKQASEEAERKRRHDAIHAARSGRRGW